MALFLDSARLEDAQEAARLGFVSGITTNPDLMAQVTNQPLTHLEHLAQAFPGTIFYQLTATETDGLIREGRTAYAFAPDKILLKIPCSLAGLAAIAKLSPQIPCAVTAIFSPQQAWLSAQAGARYVIPYINRTTRLGADPFQMVAQMATILQKGAKTEILAASLKSPQEAYSALEAGAHHLTMPLDLIRQMAEHKWSQQTIAGFGPKPPEAAQPPKTEVPQPPIAKSPGQDAPKKPGEVKVPPAPAAPGFTKSVNSPFSMLDYIVGKIELEELMAGVSQQDLKSYLAQRELEHLLEEEEITQRLDELKKRLGKG